MDSGLLVFHGNVNGFKTHAVDVAAELKLMATKPDLIMLNEAKTDKAYTTYEIKRI